MRPRELQNLLSKTIAYRLATGIKGAPGIGKTDIVLQAAAAADADVILMHPAVADPTDPKGLPALVDGRAEFLPYGDMRRLMAATRLTVGFMDDFGQAPLSVQAAFMQLFLARELNGKKISDNVVFVIATNRRQDKAGVTGILEPVKSRFATIVELTPDLEDWTRWALNTTLFAGQPHATQFPAEVIGFIRFRPGLLSDFQPTTDLTNSPSPRTWKHLAELWTIGARDPETLAGAVGEGAATEFLAFTRIFAKLPNPDAVLLAPDTADVPTDPATLYALSAALSGRATQANGARLLKYAGRLPDEFKILTVRDSLQKCKGLANLREFQELMSASADLLT